MITPEAGSVGFPARLVGGRTTAASLRSGAVVTLRTEFSSFTGRLELVGPTMRLAPTTSVEIPVGTTVRLLVVATTPQLRLKLLPDSLPLTTTGDSGSSSGSRHAMSALGLNRSVGVEELVRALINSHRELSPELVRRLAGRIGQDLPQRLRQRRARVLVELADREMEPDGESDSGEELISLLTDGRWSSGGHGDRRQPGERPASHQRLTSLQSFLSRATATPSHSLQLFNYLRSTGDLHWVVVPVGARQSESSTTGTLRVGIDRRNQTPKEATLALSVGSGVWWFSWKMGADGARLSAWEVEGDAPQIPESLLARMGGRRHTNSNRYQNGDGFSGTSSEVNKLGVDEYG
ncbi:MAG: hypothetical protein R6U25_12300 [Alkalispirochaeta sp.]